MKVSDLKINANNPQKFDDLSKLENSIREFPKMMKLRPMIYDPKTMIVLGGNKRLLAIQNLGLKEIPDDWVRPADELTEDEKKRFIVADNVGFGEWDWEILESDYEQEELEEWGIEFPEMEEETPEAKEDDFKVPDEIQTDIKIGDIFQIRQHRLMCGDSTDPEQVAKLMNGEKADMIFTDPPYGMNAVSKSGVLSKNYKKDILGDNNTEVAKKAFNLIYSLLPNATYIWWGANYYSSVLPDSECWIVWDKNNGQSDQTDCELAWSNARSVIRQFTKASEKNNRVHPTQKPIELIIWALNKFNNGDKLIIDFFLGSGSTMVAAHQLNRRCYGMELDPKYCQVIIDRMNKLDPTIEIKKL